MITFVEKGQVFENLKYYFVIKEVENNCIAYNFYNKHEFYFEPTKRKRQCFDINKVSSIEVTLLLTEFLKKIDKGSLHIVHEHFNKQPILGIKIK